MGDNNLEHILFFSWMSKECQATNQMSFVECTKQLTPITPEHTWTAGQRFANFSFVQFSSCNKISHFLWSKSCQEYKESFIARANGLGGVFGPSFPERRGCPPWRGGRQCSWSWQWAFHIKHHRSQQVFINKLSRCNICLLCLGGATRSTWQSCCGGIEKRSRSRSTDFFHTWFFSLLELDLYKVVERWRWCIWLEALLWLSGF